MIDAAFEGLAQARLDGVATIGDIARLEDILRGSHEARRRYEEMSAMFEALQSQRLLDPPPGIAPNVLRSLAQRAVSAPGAGWRGESRGLRRGPALLGYAYAFAGGALATALLVMFAGRDGVGPLLNPRDVSGTLSPIERSRAVPIDHRRVDLPDASAALDVARDGERLTMRIHIECQEDAELSLRYDPALLNVTAVRPLGAAGGLELSPGRLIIHQRGEGRYELDLDASTPATPPIAVTIGAAAHSAETLVNTSVMAKP